MNASADATPDVAVELGRCLDRLRAGEAGERRRAVADLVQLGIRMRGTISGRGSLRAAASDRGPYAEMLGPLFDCAADAEPGVRSEAVVALGEWGGEETAAWLAGRLRSGAEEVEAVRLAHVTALRSIGGPTAMNALAQTAVDDQSIAVRFAAVTALEEVAAGGWPDVTDRPALLSPQGREEALAAARQSTTSEVVASLMTIADDRAAPDFLRQKAEDAAAHVMFGVGETDRLTTSVRALEEVRGRVTDPRWRERLDRWCRQGVEGVAAAVRVVVGGPGKASRIVTEGLQSLAGPGGSVPFVPVPEVVPVQGPGRVESEEAPPALVVRASGRPQARVAVSGESAEIVVRLDDVPPGQSLPLVVLIPGRAGAEPVVKEPERRPGVGYWIARFDGLEPGDYVVAFEPMA